jgi:hypothetical protein
VSAGAGATRVTGDLEVVDPDRTFGGGIAALIEYDPGGVWAVSLQPGFRMTGSKRYQLNVLSVPLVGDVRLHRGRLRYRASLGLAPEWLTDARYDHGFEGTTDVTTDLRRWNVGAIAALAVELEQRDERVAWAYVELRGERGLFTLDPHDHLAAYTEEIGLWFGLRFR